MQFMAFAFKQISSSAVVLNDLFSSITLVCGDGANVKL
jgi:hypothetical protein